MSDASWRAQETERGRRIESGMERIRGEWQAFLGLVIASPNRADLLRLVQERFDLDVEVAEIALDQKLRTFVLMLDE